MNMFYLIHYKAISDIDMTAPYKQAMSFSKMASTAGWLVVGVGLYGNAKEIYQTYKVNDIISEACGRATTRNVTSGVFNAGVGFGAGTSLTWGLSLAAVSGGVSIIVIGTGAFVWGLYGCDISNRVGNFVEEMTFE